MTFEASLNGDYSTLDDLTSPYNLINNDFRIWNVKDSDFEKDYTKLNDFNKKSISSIWIEATRYHDTGDVIDYLKKIHWVQETFSNKASIFIFRFYN